MPPPIPNPPTCSITEAWTFTNEVPVPILTTSKPDPKKQLTLSDAVDMVERGQSITLLFGIGPHGVPKAAASIPKYNLDITPGCFSLETATALGAVCGAFAARMDLIQ